MESLGHVLLKNSYPHTRFVFVRSMGYTTSVYVFLESAHHDIENGYILYSKMGMSGML